MFDLFHIFYQYGVLNGVYSLNEVHTTYISTAWCPICIYLHNKILVKLTKSLLSMMLELRTAGEHWLQKLLMNISACMWYMHSTITGIWRGVGQEDSAREVPLAQLAVVRDGGDSPGDRHGGPLHVPRGVPRGVRPLPPGRRHPGQTGPVLWW